MVMTDRSKKSGKKTEEDSIELRALRKRIGGARLHPARDRREILKHDREPHCGDCFARGWASAVAAIEDE
jgi:hypothetical protein